MTAIASTDVTVTVVEEVRAGKKKRNRCTIAFGNGSLTYTVNGVAMPAIGKFGMVTTLDGIVNMDGGLNGYIHKYDATNNKIKIYYGDNNNTNDGPLIELITSVALATTTLTCEAVGW